MKISAEHRLLVAAIVIAVLGVFRTGSGYTAEELLTFPTTAHQEFFESLTHEYRCLKCQNQTIADSPAGLAQDLRREIYDMVIADKNKAEITDFLVQRYGDFVLYNPRFQSNTSLLWIGPPVLLLVALLIAWLVSRSRTSIDGDGNDNGDAEGGDSGLVGQAELEKARALLKE